MGGDRPDSFIHPAPVWREDIPSRLVPMYAMYASGATIAEVAEHFGVSAKRLRQQFDGCGLAVRPAGPSRDPLPMPPSRIRR